MSIFKREYRCYCLWVNVGFLLKFNRSRACGCGMRPDWGTFFGCFRCVWNAMSVYVGLTACVQR